MESGKIGLASATFTVLASMIGTGIFGISGILQADLINPWVIMTCWVIGGIIALSGALCYSEIASNYPLVGGEFVYLKHFYGELPSFLTGWISILVAFSAPVAATAYLLSEYSYNMLLSLDLPTMALILKNYQIHFACACVMVLATIHMTGVRKGIMFQNFITVIKVLAIMFLLCCGLYYALDDQFLTLSHNFSPSQDKLQVGKLGSAFLMISFSFSGWNAAIYLGSEIKDARRNIPKALFWGTSLTMILYLLLQFTIYSSLSIDQIRGETALLSLVSSKLLGNYAYLEASLNIILCLVLLSSMSVNILLGSRICYAIGESIGAFKVLTYKSPSLQTPILAILLQASIAIGYLVTGTFTSILIYMGFSLSIFPILTVGGMWILRKRLKQSDLYYKSPLFPLLPLFFMIMSIAITASNLIQNPTESLISLGLLFFGGFVYLFIQKNYTNTPKVSTPEL